MLEINKIYRGDCLEIMPQIPDKSIDMILCDLPYGTTACKWDAVIPFEPLWKQYKRLIKDNGAIVLTASQPFTTDLINSNRTWFKYELIWDKGRPSNFMLSKHQILKYHENILIFYKDKPVFNPPKIKRNEWDKRFQLTHIEDNQIIEVTGQKRKSVDASSDEKLEGSIIRILKNVYKENDHPTQKPILLFEYLIRTYTNEGDVVMDNCAGSGTTGIACKNLNRKFILIEKEEKYCQIANKRINDITGLPTP